MRSLVTGALWQSLPSRGAACLRFNFRGVEGSEGEHGGGEGEQLDVAAALDTLRDSLPAELPIGLVGWSFGADVALSVGSDTHRGWFAIAPPLKFGAAVSTAARDARPKHVALAQHDQYRDPAEVEAEVAGWANTHTEVVGGADHYFIGRTDHLVEMADHFLNEIIAH